jgi:YVTN family beta-propeller protein
MYVSDQPNNALVVIDLEQKKRTSSIPASSSPEGVAISDDGKWIVVANEEANSVSFIDTADNTEKFQVATQGENPTSLRRLPWPLPSRRSSPMRRPAPPQRLMAWRGARRLPRPSARKAK